MLRLIRIINPINMEKVTLEQAHLIARKVEAKLYLQLVEALDEDDTFALAELVAFQGVTPKLMERALNYVNDPERMDYDPYDELSNTKFINQVA
jgi:hypothetical protein